MSRETDIKEIACDMGCMISCTESRDCAKIFAENLYNAGYRKIPEGAIILTREEIAALNECQKKHFGGRNDD